MASSSNAPISDIGTLPPTFVPGFHDEASVRAMRYRPLGRTGMLVSVLALGAAPLGGFYETASEEQSVELIRNALRHGINLIDVAPWYGHGEAERLLGIALKGVPRQAYYISTKCCRHLPNVQQMFDFTAQRAGRSIDESLQRLGLSYVDILSVHDLEFAPCMEIVLDETLPALQRIKKSGKARFIGITGFPLATLRTAIERSSVPIDTILSYCHYSLNDTSLAAELLPFCLQRQVGLINASPISMGLLTKAGPPAWHPATAQIKAACRQAVEWSYGQGVALERLAVWFSLQHPDITTTVVGATRWADMLQNIQCAHASYVLTAKEQEVLSYVQLKFFGPLGNASWENCEPQTYFAKLGKSLLLQQMYPAHCSAPLPPALRATSSNTKESQSASG